MSEDQEKELEFICSLNINEYDKAKFIYKIVLDNRISDVRAVNFLYKNNLRGVAECFCTLDESNVIRKRASVASGSEWTSEHVDYFNIVFEDVNASGICEDVIVLSVKANDFLADNRCLTLRSFVGITGEELANAAKTDFQRKVMFVLLNPSKESCIDVMMQTFLESILGDRFLVEQRYKMKLTVSNTKKEATADLVAVLFPQFYIGVIVVENKPEAASDSEHQQAYAEAQMISEGIAVAQQDQWSPNVPVYMLLVMKTNVSVYKANFTHEFIRSVKNGTRRILPFVVKRYAPAPSVAIGKPRPGLDIVEPSDRDILVRIIHSMSVSIVNEIESSKGIQIQL
jgi:hypothetical protein